MDKDKIRIYSKKDPVSNPCASANDADQPLSFVRDCYSIQIVICQKQMKLSILKTLASYFLGRKKYNQYNSKVKYIHGECKGPRAGCAAV